VTDTLVPAYPIVEIDVSAEAITVDGVVVDRGSAGGPDNTVAMHLGVHAAARQVAQPLGRPVRAILRSGGEEKRLVVHPDGSVSEVEETFPVVTLDAPAGARGAPILRHARLPIATAMRVHRTRLGMVVAYAALGAVLIGGLLVEASNGDRPTRVATGAGENIPEQDQVEDPVPLAVPSIIDGSQVDRLPAISDVVARPATGGFRLKVTTGRSVRVQVLASSLTGDNADRQWTIRTSRATTRTLEFDDLAAGSYRWVVRSPGEPPRSGNVVVPPTPDDPPPVTDDPTPEQDDSPTPDDGPASDDNGGGGGGGGGGDGAGPQSGPTGPIDPDDPTAP